MIVHGFELLKEQQIPEIKTHVRLFRHLRTGAQLLSLENDDENKVFGINFRTPPEDSTGIAHIMEHSVLCGSQKYPAKEPFVELVKGSLNTFLNAFTGPDTTSYPVASQNLQDFYNLVDVYMDAVLHPLIPEHTLQQEGWHYELASVDDPLTYKGVVFNEMKGAYSNPDDLLGDKARQSLFPDNTYRVDSGGDPAHIPDLSYAQFKAFHERYYHPSNAFIFMYGDDDPEERLRRMADYLGEFEAIEIDSHVPLQPRFDQPRRMTAAFDPGDDPSNNKARLVVNWLLSETLDAERMLGLSILDHILIGTPAAPLRKALIDSGLGEDLAGGGLEPRLRQMYFSIGLKGLEVGADGAPIQGEKVEKLILDLIASLAEEGIDPETVQASMNTIEFSLRENNTGSFPRGLLLMLRALTTWIYDGDPLAPLAYEAPLNAIKARLADGKRYFEDLISEYFLDNPHRTVVTLQPEPGLNARSETDEKERLARARAAMNADDLQAIVDNTARLKELQETPDTPETLATIPQLKMEDLDRKNKIVPLEVIGDGESKILYHDLFTNGIIYLDLGFDLRAVPQELLRYVPLFGRALLEMGTDREDFVRLSQRIGRDTGGIHASTFVSMINGSADSTAWFMLRSKATPDKAGELLDILRDVLLTARLDNRERFRQMVLEEKAEKEAMLVPAGHRVVNSRLRALFNPADWIDEQMYGISSLFFLRDLARQVDQDWQVVLANMEELRNALIRRGTALCNVTLDRENWSDFRPRLFAMLADLPATGFDRQEWRPVYGARFEGLAIPAQVNYVGKGADLYRLGYEADGSIDVITNFLRTSHLWERVRVQGGAYGAFCPFNHRSGVFTFLSYRDPNLIGTLDNFDASARFLRAIQLDSIELTKNIIGAIGDLDAYQLPDAKGYASMARYLAGDSDAMRQEWRDEVLSTTVEDFHRFGELLEAFNREAYVVVLGSQDALESAGEVNSSRLQVKRVL